MEVLNNSNQQYKYQLQCVSHPGNDILYFNTNLNNKFFLVCQFCLVEQELETNQLLPFSVLNDSSRLDHCQFFHSIKKNTALYEIYQSIINEDLEQKKYNQTIKFKEFRSKINYQLDQIEKLSENSFKTIEEYVKFTKKINEDYYLKICKLLEEYPANNDQINISYQHLLIDYELESQKILDILQNIDSVNKNQFYQKNTEKLESFISEINSQVSNQFESLKQIELSSINYIFEGIKLDQIKQEQQQIIGLQNDNQLINIESNIQIKCKKCSSSVVQKPKQYLNKLELQQPNLKDTTFYLRKMNPNQVYIEFKLNLYYCSNKYIKDIINESTQIPQKYIQTFKEQDFIQNKFTKQQSNNILDYYQTHSCEQTFITNQTLINVQVFQLENIDNEYIVNNIKVNDIKKKDQFYHMTTEHVSRKNLLIELYRQIRIHLQKYQAKTQINYTHEVKSIELITDDQAILEIQQFKDIFSFYDEQRNKIDINDENQYQFNQTNKNLINLYIKDDKDNKFYFSTKELQPIIELKNYPVNENFFAEYFMKNFQDEIKIDSKNDIILFCQQCDEKQNCQIETNYQQLPSDYLIIDCSQIQLDFLKTKFQRINLNSKEILNINLLNNQKYSAMYCLAKNKQQKLDFIIKCSETQEWYAEYNNQKRQINQEDINNFIPIYLYYKKQQEN